MHRELLSTTEHYLDFSGTCLVLYLFDRCQFLKYHQQAPKILPNIVPIFSPPLSKFQNVFRIQSFTKQLFQKGYLSNRPRLPPSHNRGIFGRSHTAGPAPANIHTQWQPSHWRTGRFTHLSRFHAAGARCC